MRANSKNHSILRTTSALVVVASLSIAPLRASAMMLELIGAGLIAYACDWLLTSSPKGYSSEPGGYSGKPKGFSRPKRFVQPPESWNGKPKNLSELEAKTFQLGSVIDQINSETSERSPLQFVTRIKPEVFNNWIAEPESVTNRRLEVASKNLGEEAKLHQMSVDRRVKRTSAVGYLERLDSNPEYVGASYRRSFSGNESSWLLSVVPVRTDDEASLFSPFPYLAMLFDQRKLEKINLSEPNSLQENRAFFVGAFIEHYSSVSGWEANRPFGGESDRDQYNLQVMKSDRDRFNSLTASVEGQLATLGLGHVTVESRIDSAQPVVDRETFNLERAVTFHVSGAKNDREYILTNVLVLRAAAGLMALQQRDARSESRDGRGVAKRRLGHPNWEVY